MTSKTIIYEQPLNEQIRFCLRLEYLFAKVNHHLSSESPWNLHQVLNTILEILHITDRPNFKNKLGQALTQYASSLIQLEKLPEVDKQKLHATLKKINKLIDNLRTNTQKIGQVLRENEFLMAIQQRLYTPAGTCNFNLPAYYLWLQQDTTILKNQLSIWLSSFQQLQEITNLILKLTRESAPFKKIKANGGFYQSNLEANLHYQMIRIRLIPEKLLFPETSIGRHRLAIHFFTIDLNGRAAQTPDDITFELACCKI